MFIDFGRPWPSKNNKSFNLFVNSLALWRAVGAAVDTSKSIKILSKSTENSFKNQSKIYQKSLKNHPKIHQKSTTIYQKSTKKLLKSALGTSWSPRGSKTPPRPLQARKQGGILPPPRAPFWKDFGAMLAPRATQRPFKKHTKFSLIWKSIFHRFSSIFGRVLEGSWSQVGLQNPLQIGSRC